MKRIGAILFCLGIGIVAIGSSFVVRSQKDFKTQTPQDFNANFKIYKTTENQMVLRDLFSIKKENLVVLWATWCEPCIVELREIEIKKKELEAKYHIILVSLDGGEPIRTIPEVKAWLISQGLSLETYYDFDENLVKILGIASIPFSFGVNAQSKIVWQNNGILDLKKLL